MDNRFQNIIIDIPKIKTVEAFLKMKDWKLKKGKKVNIWYPPSKEVSGFKFEDDFYYEIPTSENILDYKEYILHQTRSLATLYQLDFMELIDLFSKSIEEIKEEIQEDKVKFKRALVASAA